MSITQTGIKLLKVPFQNRTLFHWINIVFNKVDEDRRRQFGPDRTCAEWILRNGGAVKWKNNRELMTDYNELPNEEIKLYIEEVDATGSSIMHYGFGHFIGCNHIKKIIFHKCAYLEDVAFEMLSPLKNSLENVQVSSCVNITEKGLRSLTNLNNLKDLLIFDLPYVKDKNTILKELSGSLSKCNIQFK